MRRRVRPDLPEAAKPRPQERMIGQIIQRHAPDRHPPGEACRISKQPLDRRLIGDVERQKPHHPKPEHDEQYRPLLRIVAQRPVDVADRQHADAQRQRRLALRPDHEHERHDREQRIIPFPAIHPRIAAHDEAQCHHRARNILVKEETPPRADQRLVALGGRMHCGRGQRHRNPTYEKRGNQRPS